MPRWQGIAKGTGLFIVGVMVGGAAHSTPPQSASVVTPSASPAVLAANAKADTASPSPTATPAPTPTPTATPTPTPKIATPKPVVHTVTAPKPTVVAAKCDPNYSGACVPIASDVDCAGGSGNGPAYVKGPVKVIGTDIYKLDADHNGWGCE
jgi:hypothetical protein